MCVCVCVCVCEWATTLLMYKLEIDYPLVIGDTASM